MRSMLIGCALLVFGSCAALAQQDPTPAQGGSPNAPAPAAAPTTPVPAAAASPVGMAKPMMHGHGMMHHGKMMRHHHKMMMMHHHHMMRHHRMMKHAM